MLKKLVIVVFLVSVLFVSGCATNNNDSARDWLGYPFPYYFSYTPDEEYGDAVLFAMNNDDIDLCLNLDASVADECGDLLIKKQAFEFNDKEICNAFEDENYQECLVGVNAYNAVTNKDKGICGEGVTDLSLIDLCEEDYDIYYS
tara:strand:- start:29 stop:463 length:435 start_codon:yes stop_codon:yes gene_type:complete